MGIFYQLCRRFEFRGWPQHRGSSWVALGGWLTLVTALGGSACSIQKYLPPDEYLYQGAALQVEAPKGINTSDLELELQTTINNSSNRYTPVLGYLGIYRYYRHQEKIRKKPDKDTGQPVGQEPVFFDNSLPEAVTNLLENRATNQGYFYHEAQFSLDTNEQRRAIKVNYGITVGEPHRLDSLIYYVTDSAIARIVQAKAQGSRLKPERQYSLDLLKAERQRLEGILRDSGYYFFRADDFSFLADTLTGDHEVSLLLKLNQDLPPGHLKPQTIRQINIFPDQALQDSAIQQGFDTIVYNDLRIVCQHCPLRPAILDEAFAMGLGDLYSPDQHDRTLSRLAGYNTFRYIALDYQSEPGSDSTLVLTAKMEPLLRRRIEGEIGGSYNSARYFGPELAFTYTNRNLLKGAEMLRIEGDLTYAFFLGDSEQSRVPRSGTYGLAATLDVPRLWLPWRRKILPRVSTSGTSIRLGGQLESLRINLARFGQEISSGELTELAARVATDSTATENVSLLQLNLAYGYRWQRRVTTSHQLEPFNFRLQNPVTTDPDILELASLLGLAGGSSSQNLGRFDRMALWSPGYTRTYDSRLAQLKTHNVFWQQAVSLNFNRTSPSSERQAVEPALSIYPNLETDLRYYLVLNRRQVLATRFHGGVAFPLTERAIVPYFNLYTVGGPNSLRGFAPRQLGPGPTIPIDNNLLTFGGFGNLLLEASVEFRQRLSSLIEVAAFTDVGNVWTYKSETEPLASDFALNTFTQQLGLDAGLGLRLDFQFLILRIDLAKPLVIPYADALNEPDAPSGTSLDDNIKIVVAFGHPF